MAKQSQQDQEQEREPEQDVMKNGKNGGHTIPVQMFEIKLFGEPLRVIRQAQEEVYFRTIL